MLEGELWPNSTALTPSTPVLETTSNAWHIAELTLEEDVQRKDTPVSTMDGL